ncbi:MAG: hypothetical protein HY559_00285 [Gammaproteobacteria bacterium]|nr:hypothetical protein [Gammaproteobacteria bacterium]
MKNIFRMSLLFLPLLWASSFSNGFADLLKDSYIINGCSIHIGGADAIKKVAKPFMFGNKTHTHQVIWAMKDQNELGLIRYFLVCPKSELTGESAGIEQVLVKGKWVPFTTKDLENVRDYNE